MGFPRDGVLVSSQQFSACDCPLCDHPELWEKSYARCPGCLGGKRISHFKRAELFAKYPELSRADTVREMKAVRSDEDDDGGDAA